MFVALKVHDVDCPKGEFPKTNDRGEFFWSEQANKQRKESIKEQRKSEGKKQRKKETNKQTKRQRTHLAPMTVSVLGPGALLLVEQANNKTDKQTTDERTNERTK